MIDLHSAVTWEDFLAKIPAMRRLQPKTQAHVLRLIAILYGLLSILLAFAAQGMGSILSATLTALGALSGPLGAVFAMGILMPFVNKIGAITGMLSGFFIMIWITINAFILDKMHIPLTFSASECPVEILESHSFNATFSPRIEDTELEWPDKLYTLSYILYPFAGGVITTIVAIVVSLFTGGLSSAKNIDPKYLHPIVRPRGKNISTTTKDKEMTYLSSNSGGNYMRVSTSPLSPPPDYTKVSKETQTPGYYYYAYDTESATPPPPYLNLSSPDGSQSTRPLLYRMPSTASTSSYSRR